MKLKMEIGVGTQRPKMKFGNVHKVVSLHRVRGWGISEN